VTIPFPPIFLSGSANKLSFFPSPCWRGPPGEWSLLAGFGVPLPFFCRATSLIFLFLGRACTENVEFRRGFSSNQTPLFIFFFARISFSRDFFPFFRDRKGEVTWFLFRRPSLWWPFNCWFFDLSLFSLFVDSLPIVSRRLPHLPAPPPLSHLSLHHLAWSKNLNHRPSSPFPDSPFFQSIIFHFSLLFLHASSRYYNLHPSRTGEICSPPTFRPKLHVCAP